MAKKKHAFIPLGKVVRDNRKSDDALHGTSDAVLRASRAYWQSLINDDNDGILSDLTEDEMDVWHDLINAINEEMSRRIQDRQ